VASTSSDAELQAERDAWCEDNRREDLPCRRFFANLDESFEAAWRQEWKLLIESLPSANLVEVDLSDADAPGIVLAGQDLSHARLVSADLREAQMEGANLSCASLVEADLYSARLEDARMVDADLRRARINGASLRGADLRWTDLGGALMEKVDLRTAQLADAKMGGAFLPGADLRGVEGLTQPQLADAMGDENTLLPPGLWVRSCLPEPPDFEVLIRVYLRTSDDPAKTLAETRERLLCQGSERPVEAGTPCPIDLARRECGTKKNPWHRVRPDEGGRIRPDPL
jgi:hypothetical protein